MKNESSSPFPSLVAMEIKKAIIKWGELKMRFPMIQNRFSKVQLILKSLKNNPINFFFEVKGFFYGQDMVEMVPKAHFPS